MLPSTFHMCMPACLPARLPACSRASAQIPANPKNADRKINPRGGHCTAFNHRVFSLSLSLSFFFLFCFFSSFLFSVCQCADWLVDVVMWLFSSVRRCCTPSVLHVVSEMWRRLLLFCRRGRQRDALAWCWTGVEWTRTDFSQLENMLLCDSKDSPRQDLDSVLWSCYILFGTLHVYWQLPSCRECNRSVEERHHSVFLFIQ